jgi:lipoprotein-releasing system permease protein
MSFEFFIGGRYLRAKQKQAFISLITYLSIAGVAVGVMALIVVIAVMTGFESTSRRAFSAGRPTSFSCATAAPSRNTVT